MPILVGDLLQGLYRGRAAQGDQLVMGLHVGLVAADLLDGNGKAGRGVAVLAQNRKFLQDQADISVIFDQIMHFLIEAAADARSGNR